MRVSGPALVQALLRIETVRGLGITLPATPVPPSRIAALARFANTVKVSAVARLPVARRTATLVAFIHSLEASAHDDALDVLAILLRDLFAKAEQADRKVRLRYPEGSRRGGIYAGRGLPLVARSESSG